MSTGSERCYIKRVGGASPTRVPFSILIMTQFTVVKKGQEIKFDSAFGDIEVAKYYVKEHMSFNTFAMDLLSKKKLSDKQVAWIHYLATDNLNQALEQENVRGDYYDLVTKIYSAGAKRSKFQVRLPGITISTVNRGANVGCVYIYENNQYVGKITQQGVLIGNVSEDVKNLLEDANDNLLQLAKIYGHETGNCSICGRTLSDPLSVQMGIGPICAKLFS